MRRSVLLACLAGLVLTSAAAAQTAPLPLPIPVPVQMMPGRDYAGVLASPIRTEADRAADGSREALATSSSSASSPAGRSPT